MCENCYYLNTERCSDCLPYDAHCSLFRAKNAPGSDPDSDTALQIEGFPDIYEEIMSKTQFRHYWRLKDL